MSSTGYSWCSSGCKGKIWPVAAFILTLLWFLLYIPRTTAESFCTFATTKPVPVIITGYSTFIIGRYAPPAIFVKRSECGGKTYVVILIILLSWSSDLPAEEDATWEVDPAGGGLSDEKCPSGWKLSDCELNSVKRKRISRSTKFLLQILVIHIYS